MFVHKIDEELSLKLIEIKDAERVFELMDNSREYLRQWLSWVDTIIKEEDMVRFLKMFLHGYAENRSLKTTILYKGEIVGLAGLDPINWSINTASIGYWLGEEFQGNGIMTRVVKALTDYAFTEMKLNKVEIHAVVENKKSRGIPERLGFVKEGCIRQAEYLSGNYFDVVVYGKLADEWTDQSIAD